MIIRPAKKSDLPACAMILAANPLWQRYNITEASALNRLTNGFEQIASILVAEIEENPAGFVWYSEKGAFHRSGYIMLIGVAPLFQNQGVGDKLMGSAEALIFEKSDDIFLLVSDFNRAAQRFYLRRGYTQVGCLPDYVIPGVSELIFRKHQPVDLSTD